MKQVIIYYIIIMFLICANDDSQQKLDEIRRYNENKRIEQEQSNVYSKPYDDRNTNNSTPYHDNRTPSEKYKDVIKEDRVVDPPKKDNKQQKDKPKTYYDQFD